MLIVLLMDLMVHHQQQLLHKTLQPIFNSDKATGHLGSFMEKKTETQISLDLSHEDRDLAVVKCRRSRGYPFDPFAFRVESDGLPYIQDSIPANINKESFLNI